MQNKLNVQSNKWWKYTVGTEEETFYQFFLPTCDKVRVGELALRKVNDEIVPTPISDVTEMTLQAETYTIWKQSYTHHASTSYDGYRLVVNSGSIQGYGIINKDLYWYSTGGSYTLYGHPDEGISTSDYEQLRGHITMLYNNNDTTPKIYYAYITEDTEFEWNSSGGYHYVKDFYLLVGLNRTSGLKSLYDKAYCFDENSTTATRRIYIPDPMDIDKLYSYSYSTDNSQFNSREILDSEQYVFISSGLYGTEYYPDPSIAVVDKTFKFSNNYYSNPESPIWHFESTTVSHAVKSYVDDVTSMEADAYPADGPEGDYYYQKVYQAISTPLERYTLDDSDLIGGVEYSIDIDSDSDIQVGQCASASITFRTYTNALKKNSVVYYSVKFNDTLNAWTDVGPFIVTDITQHNNVYTITAYDYMSKLDAKANVESSFYASSSRHYLIEHMEDVCGTAGVECSIGDATNTSAYFNNNWLAGTMSVSLRQALGYLAAIAGCFAIADSTGTITFHKYARNTRRWILTNADYTSFDFILYDVPQIDKVYIAENDGDDGYVSGSGNNALKIIGNRYFYSDFNGVPNTTMLQTMTDNIYNYVSSIPSYTPGTVYTYSDYNIQVGCNITVDEKTFIVMKKSWSSSGVVLESTGNEYRDELKITKKETLENKINEVAAVTTELSELIDDDGNISMDNVSGGTLTIGGPDDQFGVLQALDNSSNLIGYWDNSGLQVDDITITQSLYSGQTLTEYLTNGVVPVFG